MVENDLISVQTHKEVIHLGKTFLTMLEDLKLQHKEMLKKFSNNVNDDFIKELDYLTSEYSDHLRKRTLDTVNETSRSLNSFINLFDFQINPEKVQEALSKQKTVFKRIVIGSVLIEKTQE